MSHLMKHSLALLLSLICCVAACTGLAEKEAVQVPEVNVQAFEGPDNEAMAFLRTMGVGWNLGNTFDAYNDALPASREMDQETIWHGARTTEAMIAAVHDAGFTTIRMPVTWHNHVDADFNISEQWLDRVQEVLDYAYSRGMYVILDTHHDEGKDYFYPTEEYYETSERYISRIWAQLAERFADYDEHLIFESLNEPRLKGHPTNEWTFTGAVPACREAAECINRLNQVFVDTVRAAGSYNETRYLMVPAYAATPAAATNAFFVLPNDTADNRIIVSAHAYTPYNFALQDGGTSEFSLKSTRSTREITKFMDSLYKKYIANGIPVIIGEFGAREKNGNLQARVDFTSFYVANASARNMPCCWWDNNCFTGDGERFGLLRRYNCTWIYPQIVEALTTYAMTNVQ